MDDTPNGREYELDLGGERSCWLDEVCVSCGAIDGHRTGCEFAEPEDEMVTLVARVGSRTRRNTVLRNDREDGDGTTG